MNNRRVSIILALFTIIWKTVLEKNWKIYKKFKKVVDKVRKVGIIVRVENTNSGPLVKGLRHRLFTAVTRVRIPYGLWYVVVEALDGKRSKKFQKSVDKRKHLWYTNIVVAWEKWVTKTFENWTRRTNVQGTITKVIVLNNEKTINLSVTEMSENSNF